MLRERLICPTEQIPKCTPERMLWDDSQTNLSRDNNHVRSFDPCNLNDLVYLVHQLMVYLIDRFWRENQVGVLA